MKIKIQNDLKIVMKKNFNYYDLAFCLYDYCDDLARDKILTFQIHFISLRQNT